MNRRVWSYSSDIWHCRSCQIRTLWLGDPVPVKGDDSISMDRGSSWNEFRMHDMRVLRIMKPVGRCFLDHMRWESDIMIWTDLISYSRREGDFDWFRNDSELWWSGCARWGIGRATWVNLSNRGSGWIVWAKPFFGNQVFGIMRMYRMIYFVVIDETYICSAPRDLPALVYGVHSEIW